MNWYRGIIGWFAIAAWLFLAVVFLSAGEWWLGGISAVLTLGNLYTLRG